MAVSIALSQHCPTPPAHNLLGLKTGIFVARAATIALAVRSSKL